jgi:hypothetical protein
MFSTSFNVGTMIETELSVLDIWYVGADDGIRTRDLRFTKPLLYQLSYVGKYLKYSILCLTPDFANRVVAN